MHPAIKVSYETERGCGYRTDKGATYLRGSRFLVGDENFPLPLISIQEGIKQTHFKGYKWLSKPYLMWNHLTSENFVLNGIENALMLWVGSEHYTKEEFMREALEIQPDGLPRGISRRIRWQDGIPGYFTVGKDWVVLAHIEGMRYDEWQQRAMEYGFDVSKFSELYDLDDKLPAIFSAFIPQSVEVLVDGTETDAEIDDLVKRGFTPVLVVPVDKAGNEISKSAAKEAGQKKRGRPRKQAKEVDIQERETQEINMKQLEMWEDDDDN